MFETLESRRLLTASLNGGILTITGGVAGDSLVAENQGSNIKVIENGTKISLFKASKVNHIVFNGLAGNDTLTNSSIKPSIMNGDGDNDILIGSSTVADDFNGGSESDSVSYASRSQNLTLSIAGASDGANGGAEGDNIRGDVERVVGGGGNDAIVGSANADALEGGAGHDDLRGLAGNDILIGSTGNDVLDGGDDSDDMNGGEGDDQYIQSVRFVSSMDTMTDSAGIDTLDFSGSFTKFDVDMALDSGQVQELNNDALARLTGVFENAIGGPFSSQIRGNAADNILDNRRATFDGFVDGRGGNDWLIGSPSVGDNMFGGGGDDLFDGVSQSKDGADLFDGGAGFDTMSYAARSNVLEIIVGLGDEDGELNEGDDVRQTVEHVIGGSGDDNLGVGIFFSPHWLEGRDGDDILLAAEGSDTLEGGNGDDQIRGDRGNDVIDGGAGSDNLTGGDGNDTYRQIPGGNDLLIEVNLTGTDTIDFSGAASGITFSAALRNVSQVVDAAGNRVGILGDFENLIGSAFNDSLHGDAFNNEIRGGDGNDTLSGGAGDDTLTGDGGSDQLFGEAGDDRLIATDGLADTLDGGSGGETLGDTAIFDAALDIVSNCENLIGARPAINPAVA